MIISEKQVMKLIQMAQVYLNCLDTLYKFDKCFLTDCGLHNKIEIATILMNIANKQPSELKEIQ